METLINNWYIIVGFFAVGMAAGVAVYCFIKKPTEEQLDNVREWLLGAVTDAEKELGGGTGQLKLRQVYDRFVVRFPWLAKIVSFDTFAELVDEALEKMRAMLAQNEAVQEYVAGVQK